MELRWLGRSIGAPWRREVVRAGVQEATIHVEGAYQPNVLTVKAGLPVRLMFDRAGSVV